MKLFTRNCRIFLVPFVGLVVAVGRHYHACQDYERACARREDGMGVSEAEVWRLSDDALKELDYFGLALGVTVGFAAIVITAWVLR